MTGAVMIDVLHWLASFVVLSVALAHLEAIKVNSMQTMVRSIGWAMLGIEAFAAILMPFFPYFNLGCKLGEIGFAVLAISYRYQGATRYVRHR